MKTHAISQGFSLIVTRMKKLEEQNHALIQLAQKYQEEFQEITKENKKLLEKLQYLSVSNREFSTMNNKLKYDLQEKNCKPTNVTSFK